MHLKFLIYPCDPQHPALPDETPVLFPSWVSHKAFHTSLSTGGLMLPRPIYGGFVKIVSTTTSDKLFVVCYGESISLGLQSCPAQSAPIIERYI